MKINEKIIPILAAGLLVSSLANAETFSVTSMKVSSTVPSNFPIGLPVNSTAFQYSAYDTKLGKAYCSQSSYYHGSGMGGPNGQFDNIDSWGSAWPIYFCSDVHAFYMNPTPSQPKSYPIDSSCTQAALNTSLNGKIDTAILNIHNVNGTTYCEITQ